MRYDRVAARLVRVGLGGLAVLACDGRSNDPGAGSVHGAAVEYILESPRVMVSAESELLAQPRDIAVDPVGRLYVLDRYRREVLVLSAEGELQGTIGRPGQGPGEFSDPLFLAVRGDSLLVYDYGRLITHVFSLEGAHLGQYHTPTFGVPTHMSFGADGWIAYSGLAVPPRGGLVALLDPSRQQQTVVGGLLSEHVIPPPDLLERVQRRELPDFMRNSALPILGPDGALWVFLQTEGVLQLLAKDASLAARVELRLPEMDAIKTAFFDWYASVGARDALHFFGFVETGLVAGGRLWLLWNMPPGRPGVITVHDETGALAARLSVRGTEDPGWSDSPPRRRFAVDLGRQRLYLMDQNALAISWVQLPSELSGQGSPAR